MEGGKPNLDVVVFVLVILFLSIISFYQLVCFLTVEHLFLAYQRHKSYLVLSIFFSLSLQSFILLSPSCCIFPVIFHLLSFPWFHLPTMGVKITF